MSNKYNTNNLKSFYVSWNHLQAIQHTFCHDSSKRSIITGISYGGLLLQELVKILGKTPHKLKCIIMQTSKPTSLLLTITDRCYVNNNN